MSTWFTITNLRTVDKVSSLPANCQDGDGAFVTGNLSGQNLYACLPTNTWTTTLQEPSTVRVDCPAQSNYWLAFTAIFLMLLLQTFLLAVLMDELDKK